MDWYGHDPHALLPPENGLSTVEVNVIQVDLTDEIILVLYQEIDPCRESSTFGVDVYQIGLDLVENILPL